jgi:ABC-type transporter Mla subunit MlaD
VAATLGRLRTSEDRINRTYSSLAKEFGAAQSTHQSLVDNHEAKSTLSDELATRLAELDTNLERVAVNLHDPFILS